MVALLALTPAAASAAGWLPSTPINTAPSNINPSVAMDAAGNTIASWENNPSSPFEVQGARRLVGSSVFTALADFSTGADATTDNQTPLVVMSRNGNGLVAWIHTTTPANNDIKIASVKSDGTVTGVDTIDTAGGGDANLTAAIDDNGDAVVGWLKGTAVEVTTRQGLAGSFGAEQTLDGAASGSPSAAIDGSGNALVVWPHNTGAGIVVDGSHHPLAGAWTSAGASLATASTQPEPFVAANPNGQMVVAFLDTSSSDFVKAVTGTTSAGWGLTPTANTLSGTGVSHGPVVTMLDNGGAAVGWSVGSPTNAVQMSLKPQAGSFPAPAGVKSVASLSTPDSFTIGGNGAGELMAVWYENDPSSANNVVRASVKPAGTNAFSAPQTISDPGKVSTNPILSVDRNGDAVAAFMVGMGTQGVAAAFYDATPPTVGALSGPSTGTTGTPVTFSVPQPTDNFVASPSVSWNLGDGSPAASGTQVTHTYSASGAYTVTVTVTDNAGNATTQTKVLTISKASTPPPPPPPLRCVVPKLKGKTLSQATTALHRANCALGKVTKPRKPKHRKLRRLIVKATVPTAGTSRPAGTKVALTLVEVPKPKPKHKKHK